MLDDHLPLLRPGLFPEVLGRLFGAPPVPTGHDDPGAELQQLPGQGLPYAAVGPGHDDRLPPHGVGWVAQELRGFLSWEQTAHEQQDTSADNSGYEHRGGHGGTGRWAAL